MYCAIPESCTAVLVTRRDNSQLLVKSKEHLPTSSNLSNERAIFEADRSYASPLSRDEFFRASSCGPDGHLHLHALSCVCPAFLAPRERIRGRRGGKKPCPCTRLPLLGREKKEEKIRIPQTGRGGRTCGPETARVFRDPGRRINCRELEK